MNNYGNATRDPLDGDSLKYRNTKLQSSSTKAPLPAEIQHFMKTNRAHDVFIRGKYKGSSFSGVYANDPEYIFYILEDCDSPYMMKDRDNLIKWLQLRIKSDQEDQSCPNTTPHQGNVVKSHFNTKITTENIPHYI